MLVQGHGAAAHRRNPLSVLLLARRAGPLEHLREQPMLELILQTETKIQKAEEDIKQTVLFWIMDSAHLELCLSQ